MKTQYTLFCLRVSFLLLGGLAVIHAAARTLWAVSGPLLKYTKDLKQYEASFWNLPDSGAALILLHLTAPQILYLLYLLGRIPYRWLLKKRTPAS